jgi:hypothetical protein
VRLWPLAATALAVLGLTALLEGVGVAPQVLSKAPRRTVGLWPAARRAVAGEEARLVSESAGRRAKELTLRVRNVS